MEQRPAVATYLFTDIEGSTQRWEQEPERMRPALARHDALGREAVETHGGVVVKSTGDGMLAVFGDPLDAVHAILQLQLALTDPRNTSDVALLVRSGLHAGVDERRENDFFGPAVNRAARIMSAAHGGQILLSQAVVVLVGQRLPTGVALRDLGAVRLRGLASPELVYQVVHQQLRQDFPALRSLEATPNNLPQQVTSFIGREAEVAEVRKWLGKTRLLTLLGVGGLGKTRLSLEVAAEVLHDYPDGVWFVELAPVSDPRLVANAVAATLGVKEEPGRPVIDTLRQFVCDRAILLVLDNCEHLLLACAQLARDLLQAGPRMAIVATSREPLHVAGEAVFPLATLPVPDPASDLAPDTLGEYPAVQLFLDRAIDARPDFALTRENAAAVAQICRDLDGIPLALELAAARVRSMSVAAIARHLTDRFALLKGGDQTALPRQQTLRAAIDWSYDLLAPRGARAAATAVGVRRRIRVRRGRGGRRGRRRRVARCAGPAGAPGRQVAGRVRCTERALPICWRRCGSTRWSASPNRARTRAPATGISNSTSHSPSMRSANSLASSGTPGSPASTPSGRTSCSRSPTRAAYPKVARPA